MVTINGNKNFQTTKFLIVSPLFFSAEVLYSAQELVGLNIAISGNAKMYNTAYFVSEIV